MTDFDVKVHSQTAIMNICSVHYLSRFMGKISFIVYWNKCQSCDNSIIFLRKVMKKNEYTFSQIRKNDQIDTKNPVKITMINVTVLYILIATYLVQVQDWAAWIHAAFLSGFMHCLSLYNGLTVQNLQEITINSSMNSISRA